MTDVDLEVVDSFERLFPVPFVVADWEDVLGRAGATRNGRRRFGRPGALRRLPRRHRVLVLVAAVLVALLAVATAIGGLGALFLDKGFIGLPPLGATPSPEGGELVLSSYGVARGERTLIWVYADGRLISLRDFDRAAAIAESANEHSSGYLEQELTSEGVERLRSEVLSTGLFERDLNLSLGTDGTLPGTLPSQPCWNFIDVGDGDRLVSVTWGGRQCRSNAGAQPATAEQERTLPHLIDRITNAEAWLPTSAWERKKIRAYVPSRYAVCFVGWPPMEPSDILPLLPKTAADLLGGHEFDRFGLGGFGPCAELSTEEARAVAGELERGGLEPFGGRDVLAYRIEGTGRSVQFEPYLPHGSFVCSSCG